MPQRLEQTQETIQTQQQAALQVAVAKMVELPITELAARVRDELVENAALEEADGGEGDVSDDGLSPDDDTNTGDGEENEPGDDEESGEQEEGEENSPYDAEDGYSAESEELGNYFSADDVPDYLRQRADSERDKGEMQLAGAASFYDELESQVGEHNLSAHERELMQYLIGSLDDDGLLRKDLGALADELAVYHGIDTSEKELEGLLSILQEFEPRGIGARSLQECMHIQLTDSDRRSPYTDFALAVVDRCFKDFVGRRWESIKQRLHIDDETLDHVRHELTHLNPMPGRALGESGTAGSPTVVPDFYVQVDEAGELKITLNKGEVPELRVSPAFRDSIRQYGGGRRNLSREQKDAYTYARQKVDAAVAFLNLLNRRRQTLLKVMQAIADFQHPFFTEEDDEAQLRPLTLKEVAARAGVDISTASRVTSSKYVQTLYGTYPLKFFFSSQFTTSDGDELSARKVKAALARLLEQEDKHSPLPDEALAAQLKAQGFNVARRTVAKYRDMLGFPTARLRKA